MQARLRPITLAHVQLSITDAFPPLLIVVFISTQFEQGVEEVQPKYLSSLIDLISSALENLSSSSNNEANSTAPPSLHTSSSLLSDHGAAGGSGPIESCKRQFRAQLVLIRGRKERAIARLAQRAEEEEREREQTGNGGKEAEGEKKEKTTKEEREPDWAAVTIAGAAQKMGV